MKLKFEKRLLIELRNPIKSKYQISGNGKFLNIEFEGLPYYLYSISSSKNANYFRNNLHYSFITRSILGMSHRLCSFFNMVQDAFAPPPPSLPPFEHLIDFILTDWEALYTALRLDKIRHRSVETMSSVP